MLLLMLLTKRKIMLFLLVVMLLLLLINGNKNHLRPLPIIVPFHGDLNGAVTAVLSLATVVAVADDDNI